MLKEIGSDFWLDRFEPIREKDIDFSLFGIPYADVALLSSGRLAISYVLDHLEDLNDCKKALLPAYTCATVIKPFIEAGFKVSFFNLGRDLLCKREELLKKLTESEPDVLLVHGYYGFNTFMNIRDIVTLARNNGVVVVEDITHTMYSGYDHLEADFHVGSLRKWGPLPDGALVFRRQGYFKDKPLLVNEALQEAKLEAFHAKYLYMMQGDANKAEFRGLYRYAEELIDNQGAYYTIGDISRGLQANLDIHLLRSRRRDNFNALLEITERVDAFQAVFGYLPKEVTPLYFPTYVTGDRNKLQQYFAQQSVYCPIIWPQPKYCTAFLDSDTEWIYDRILAIPCDQRYGIEDMERIGLAALHYGN